MPRYETLMLTVPHITSDEARNLEKAYEDIIKKNDGTFLSLDRWGKFRLAYPVRKNDYGIYYLTRIELPEGSEKKAFDELRNLMTLKFNAVVMRHMNSLLQEGESLEYQRPESLEDTPTRDVGQFLRENKMESLLPSVEGKDKKAAPAESQAEVTESVEVSKETIDG